MADSLKNSNQETNYDEDNGETNITPSVIRRGLCIFPMEGKNSFNQRYFSIYVFKEKVLRQV